MAHRRFLRLHSLLFTVALISLTACSSTSGTTPGASGSASPAATNTPLPTVTAAPTAGDTSGEVHALTSACREPGVTFAILSDAVGRLNTLLHMEYRIDTEDRRTTIQSVAAIMGARVEAEGGADDCSRVAWLYLYLNDKARAQRYTEVGLAKDGDNEHCHRMGRRLNLI